MMTLATIMELPYFPILIAAGLGALIGLEREISHKSAGLRTNILISIGAALFTIISTEIGDSRIEAGIVSGIGFLGAGAIIQDRGGIQGLTTAASIWLVASVGMACGNEMYELAVFTAIFAVIVLFALPRVPGYHHEKSPTRKKKLHEDKPAIKENPTQKTVPQAATTTKSTKSRHEAQLEAAEIDPENAPSKEDLLPWLSKENNPSPPDDDSPDKQ